MNIACISDTFLPQVNGVSTSICMFKEAFEKLGHKVYVICPAARGIGAAHNNVWRFRSLSYPFQPEYKVASPFSRNLLKFKHLDIDIIHVHSQFSLGYLSQFLAHRYKIPIIHTYHTLLTECVHYFPVLPKACLQKLTILETKRFCDRCNGIIAPSEHMKRKLLQYGVQAKIEVIPTGIDINITVSEQEKDSFLKKYSLTKEHTILIYAGRLAIEKNIYFLLESFQQILREIPSAILLVCGDGPERARMENRVKKLSLGNHIIFTGYIKREDLFVAFAAAKLYLFPSVTETQGLTVIESFAVGTPVIGINRMGSRDVLKNDMGGFLAKNDIRHFSHLALSLLKDDRLYNRKKIEAIQRAKDYSCTELAVKMLSLYQQTIADYKHKI